MSHIKLKISGSGSVSRAPELALLVLTIEARGETRNTVSEEIRKATQPIQARLREFAPTPSDEKANTGAAVASWSVGSVGTSAYVDRHGLSGSSSSSTKKGKQPPSRYTSYADEVTVTAQFRDFDRLNEFAALLASLDHVAVQSVSWSLTAETEGDVKDAAVAAAYRDAEAKAQAYRRAVGAQSVRPVKIENTDGGEDAEAKHHFSGNVRGRFVGGSASGSGKMFSGIGLSSVSKGGYDYKIPLSFVPEDVSCSAKCNVDFEIE